MEINIIKSSSFMGSYDRREEDKILNQAIEDHLEEKS